MDVGWVCEVGAVWVPVEPVEPVDAEEELLWEEEELEELEGAEVELLGVGVGTGAEDSASPQAAKRPAVERSNSTVLILFTLKNLRDI